MGMVVGSTGAAADGSDAPAHRLRDSILPMFGRPPGWVFHIVMLVLIGIPLSAVSFPAGHDSMWLYLTALPILALGGAWAIRLLTFLLTRSERRTGSSWRFVIAPTLGVIALGLIIGLVPLRIRWWQSRSDFERVVASAPPKTADSESVAFDVPDHLGTYDIVSAVRGVDGVVFWEANGSGIFDDAGFAYMPSGPSDELLRSPHLVALGGGWYAWTATW